MFIVFYHSCSTYFSEFSPSLPQNRDSEPAPPPLMSPKLVVQLCCDETSLTVFKRFRIGHRGGGGLALLVWDLIS